MGFQWDMFMGLDWENEEKYPLVNSQFAMENNHVFYG